MSFSESEIEKINQHLERYGPATCPNCDSSAWTTMPFPGAIVAQQQSSVNIYKTLQVIQLICDTCGYVVQFDASKLGLDMEAEGAEKRRGKKK